MKFIYRWFQYQIGKKSPSVIIIHHKPGFYRELEISSTQDSKDGFQSGGYSQSFAAWRDPDVWVKTAIFNIH